MLLGKGARAVRRLAWMVAVLLPACCSTLDRGKPLVVQSVRYEPSRAALANPERGFHGWSTPVTEDAPDADFSALRARGDTLAFAYLLLADYVDRPISEAWLDRLEDTFEAARRAGVKLVLRPAYELPGTTPEDAPAVTLARAEAHLVQLAPILAANADTLAVMQAGMIGPWGEWHSARGEMAGRLARDRIVAALLDAVPESRFVQLRTPTFMAEQAPRPQAPERAYSADPAARIGHHNDCFLASSDDMGTYFPPEAAAAQRAYLERATRFAPVGGETCQGGLPSQRSDCRTALAEFERFHWTFLNRDYDRAVIARWEAGGCLPEIERRLGYRLALQAARLIRPSDAARPGAATPRQTALAWGVELDLVNTGWARVHGPRDVVLHLVDGTGEEVAISLSGSEADCAGCPGGDVRHWLPGPGETVQRRFWIRRAATLPPGRYKVMLSLPDPSPRLAERADYAIALANEGIWDAATGRHALGLTLDVPAPAS